MLHCLCAVQHRQDAIHKGEGAHEPKHSQEEEVCMKWCDEPRRGCEGGNGCPEGYDTTLWPLR